MEVKMHIIYHVWQLAETYFQLQLFIEIQLRAHRNST